MGACRVRVALTVAFAVVLCWVTNAQTIQQIDDAKLPRFEVVSVKPNTGPPGPFFIDGRQFRNSGRAIVTNMPLLAMIQVLFREDDPTMLIEGGPDWMRVDRFDIVATGEPGSDAAIPPGRPLPRMNQMLRALLAERFNLRTHIEHRRMQIYALVPSDTAHPTEKLHVTKTADCAAVERDPEHRCGLRSLGPGGISAVGITVNDLARSLSGAPMLGLDRPVENRTGIEGRFDIEVKQEVEGARTITDQDGRTLTLFPMGPERGARLITLLKDQLGLALRSVPGERDVLVIDNAEHPTPN
jgi:uncharacterized protein (TIGR03435 family)